METNQTSEIRGHLIIQEVNFGKVTEASVQREASRFSPSGAAFNAAMRSAGYDIGDPVSEDNETDSTSNEPSGEETKVPGRKSSKSFQFSANWQSVARMLTTFDNYHKDDAFQQKLEALVKVQKSSNIKELRGADKAAAMAKLKPFCFRAYTVQIQIILPASVLYKGKNVINSKKLHYIQTPSVVKLKGLLQDVIWIDKKVDDQSSNQSDEDADNADKSE